MGLTNEVSSEHFPLSLQQFPPVLTARGFEALVSCAITLVCMVCLTPQLFLPVFPAWERRNAPPASCHLAHLIGLLAVWSLCLAACLCLSYQSEWIFFNSWLLDFYTVQFSGSLIVLLFFLKYCCLLLVVQGSKACLPTSPPWLMSVIFN